MESLAPPPSLKLNSNHVESWKLWKQRFKLYMDSTSPDNQKVAILLHVIGVECLEIYNTFSEVSSVSINDILDKFEAHFVSQRNITYERQRLFLLVRREGQSVDDFISELRKQLINCDYGSLSDYVLVDQLVRGLRESRLRERLLRVPDLDINKAVDMCRASETSKLQAQVYFTEERSIDAIKRFKLSPEVKPRAIGQANKLRQPAKREESSGRKCHYCGIYHVPGRCPTYGKECRSCGKRNHFARVCNSKSDNGVCQNNAVEFTNSANICKYPPEQLFVGTVSSDSVSSSWQAILLINDRPVNFKIDTEAQANIISKKLLNKIYGSRVNVRKTSVNPSTYTGQTIELLGCTELPVKKDLNSPIIHLDFLVTKNSYQPILGLSASADKLCLIGKCDNVNKVNCCKSISNLLLKYNQVSEGLGNLPGTYHITLCENSVPVVSVTRKVAFSLLEPLKTELARMVKAGVIEKVTEPTDSDSPLVIVQKKNGALRVCLDPQNLNKAIKRPQYNLPTFEDITSKLAGAKYFSVLDAASAFWQISLDEESSSLCTFSSPFGRFKFLCMPYGIKCAPERFQRVVAEMLEDIQNADNFFDDLIVWGKTLEEHNETLQKVFKRCIEFNLKLTFFDPRIESEIVVDASPFGLGAVLQQRGKPITFASSTLTPKQRNYAHIEKELLAVVYGFYKLILDDDLNKTLKQFWEIESVDVKSTVDTEAYLCEDPFVRTHKRNEEGRYVVSMALSRDPSCLGNSKDMAVRQLNSLWKRLFRDSEYFSLYTDFLREYEDLGHLERVVESSEPPTQYYIPHHGVLRPDKLTTKFRVVFNASSPTTTGISLNDILMKGDVIEDVFQTISRFRRHKFAFTTDIQKMYRQILIDPDQKDFQRIVWKTGPNTEVSAYRLKTVTYGMSNAPFLAIRTLQQLAEDEKSRFPLASEALLHDTYIDDIVSGPPDLKTARMLQSQLRDALQSCGMTLHKWSSNSPELLNSSLSTDVEHSFLLTLTCL
ncbi:Uncharacterized protein K02A2.6 [Araneus ventricosus]|uniref:RNA-directed DNA polymerase n=1 Tax=Araneus ventricosus TaxID=182803 RepID=A0A4Y2J9L2_ARAVE|nr:Uncharacterized protein K02A2.6 [Araneus ventricosus]